MAILSKIRERSIFLILIIALGLLAFLIQPDQLISLFNGGSKDFVLKAAGETVSSREFAARVEASKNNGKSTLQTVNQIYNAKLNQIVLQKEFDNLGMQVEKDEMWELTKNAFKSYPNFKNDKGEFDEGLLKVYIEKRVAENPLAWKSVEDQIAAAKNQQLYSAMIKSAFVPTNLDGKSVYKMQNDLLDMQYVYIPYKKGVDKDLVIADSEVQSYISKHSSEFQTEAKAAIEFVYFEEKASAEDIALNNQKIKELLPEFKTTNDLAGFLAKNSATPIDSSLRFKNQLPKGFQAAVESASLGSVFGPYQEGINTNISRLVSVKEVPSVNASHILFAYEGAMRSTVTKTKEEAQAEANKILALAKSGGDFAELARNHSDGPSKTKGGDLGWFYEGQMVKQFNDYVFANQKGSIGLVETDFGFHVIKVVDTKTEPKYNVATLTLKNEASQKTIAKLYEDATQFEIDVTSGDFTEIAKAKSLEVKPMTGISNLSENLAGVAGSQRKLVKWIFNTDTNLGDVSRFDANGGYIVTKLVSRSEKGLMSVADASAKVLPILRNKAQAKKIMSDVSGSSIEEIAKSGKTSVKTVNAVSLFNPTLPGAGKEPEVVGTAFGLEIGETSKMIEGKKGVFVVKPVKRLQGFSLPSYKGYALENLRAVDGKLIESLKENTEIVDNRAVIY